MSYRFKITPVALASFKISKKAVTVTATDASKIYGEADPEDFNFSYNLLYPEHKLNGQLSRTPGENVGVYEIGQGTLTNENNPNYDITFISGKFIIEPDKSGIEGLTIDNVKSTDKENVEYVYNQLENAVTDLADADKKAEWNTLKSNCAEMLNLIESIVDGLANYKEKVAGYDIKTVTSDDTDDLEGLDYEAGQFYFENRYNLTEEETKEFDNILAEITALRKRISTVADEIVRIESAINSYDVITVKSSDKADIEQLIADIKELLDTHNITADERTLLSGADETCTKLIEKIDETVAEICRINDATNAYDKATVTSADRADIEKLIDDIKALTDGDNLTEDERVALEEADKAIDELVEKLTEIAEEIKRVDEAVKSYDEEKVKSTDKEDLAQLKDDVQALIDSGNTTENEKTALEEMIKDIEGLEDKIEEIETQLERIAGIENIYNPETVTSDDKVAIQKTIAEIETVNPDNLTDEQKAEYEEIKAGLEALLDEIAAAEKAVEDIGAELEMFDEESITVFREEEIEAFKEKLDELLADKNMGEAAKAKLNEYKAQADNLIEIIHTPVKYFSLRFFYFIRDCFTWKYNGIFNFFSKIFNF